MNSYIKDSSLRLYYVLYCIVLYCTISSTLLLIYYRDMFYLAHIHTDTLLTLSICQLHYTCTTRRHFFVLHLPHLLMHRRISTVWYGTVRVIYIVISVVYYLFRFISFRICFRFRCWLHRVNHACIFSIVYIL